MASVISLLNHKKQVERPILILVGLHQSNYSGPESDPLNGVLRNCETILSKARFARVPVAFVRCIAPSLSISEPRIYPAWLKGLEPTRNDMIFDVTRPSCYSNSEFAQTIEYSNGNFAIAGLFGETTCLATAIDAHHRRHQFTYLPDASACRNNGNVPADLFHGAISQVISVYGNVMESVKWSQFLQLSKEGR